MPRSEATARPISLTGLRQVGVMVGLGEAQARKADPTQDTMLVAYGLGSCVALCLWDENQQVAGMAHVVMPGEDPSGAPNPRFARSALAALLRVMREHGSHSQPQDMAARLVGGARILPSNLAGSVGTANADALREVLQDAGIPIRAQDLGGGAGRSVWFDPREGGHLRVRAIGSSDRYL